MRRKRRRSARPRKNFTPVAAPAPHLSSSCLLHLLLLPLALHGLTHGRGSFRSVGGHHHYHRRRRRRAPPSTALLRSLPPSAPVPVPLPCTPAPSRFSRRRNMAPRQKIRPSTPSLSRATPVLEPVFSNTSLPLAVPRHFPTARLASFFPPGPCRRRHHHHPLAHPPHPPSRPPSLPRCILNQSLGGNAITRHHDASTIFYFKLLYVLVPPPCSPR